jgi:hypothetical protein
MCSGCFEPRRRSIDASSSQPVAAAWQEKKRIFFVVFVGLRVLRGSSLLPQKKTRAPAEAEARAD